MANTATSEPITALQNLLYAQLKGEEIARLMRLKQEIGSGRRSEATMEYKRLAFARFRYRLGLLHDR